jgi:hypothetical protein
MAETAETKSKQNPPKQEELKIPKYLEGVDRKVYRQVAIFFSVALVVAVVFWVFLRIGQEFFVRTQIGSENPVTTQSPQQDPKTIQASYDQQRKNDVYMINSAIQAYFLENKETPSALKELEKGFLNELPKDPISKKGYQYEASGSKKSWKIWTVLSDGASFEIEGPESQF